MKTIIINANTDLGVDIDGTNLGPKLISNSFKDDKRIEKIINIDKPDIIKSKDKNDLSKNIDSINKFNNNLYNKVIEVKTSNCFPIILGGDHSISIGSSLASIKQEKNMGIIWIDSHIDYNTLETTITGNIHGLPLAAVNGLNKELSLFHVDDYYSPKNTVVVGYRAMEDNREIELNNINKMGVTVFTTDDLKNIGIKEIITKAFEIACNGTNGVHISFDLDVIDPIIAPGVSVREENGINEEETNSLIEEVLKYKDKIKSFDLVEYNPIYDINHKTEKVAIKILDKVINSKLK